MFNKNVITETRNKLYFNKYQYKASFQLNNARYCIMSKNMREFFHYLAKYNISKKYDSKKAENFIDFYNSKGKDCTIRVESSFVSIFSNNLEFLKEHCVNFSDAFDLKYYRANVHNDVIVFKNVPKYNFRTYFKSKYLDKSDKDKLREFLHLHVNDKVGVKPCSAILSKLASWYPYQNEYIHGSHFIDYNEESFSSILHIMLGEYIGKHYKLVWAGEKINTLIQRSG